jgi:two-component system, cell cycle response regulator
LIYSLILGSANQAIKRGTMNMENQMELATEQLEIFIVEDSRTQAERLKHILELENFRVTWAQNGKEALARLEQYHPAMVISDILMPEMDGFELCRQIKSDHRLRNVPVILLTSLASMGDVLNGLKCGADNFITKPYNEDFLLSRIRYILLNQNLRKVSTLQMGMEIYFEGQKHYINSERVQILDLLISTFESAVSKNLELEAANRELAKAKDLLEKQAVELQALSLRDELTGLYNRRGFMTLAEHQIKVALRTQNNLFLIFADLDDLKSINDTHGHSMGDRALLAASQILQTTYRQSDLVARLGGDEFVVLHLCSSNDCVDVILNRLQDHLRQYNSTSEDHPFEISLSIGFAWYDPCYPVTLEELLKEADEMMYTRKKEKKAKLHSRPPSGPTEARL